MDYNELAELLLPGITETPDELELKYPPRVLPEGAAVTRIAPSPTGFMHLGNLFGAIADERLAHQSGGVFYLRIEDTDQKREVEGAVETILNVFRDYELPFDEGATLDGDSGAYGPYRQRQRESLYKICAKQLIRQGKAYPCFCTEQELTDAHEKQAELKENFGYYGKWAKHRDLPLSEVKTLIDAGAPFVLRFRSEGDLSRRVKFTDLVKGAIEFPENDQDIVLLKSDGIPTYHFAHVVDDHFMRTTHVVRGEEWLATLPIHVQLFAAMGWKLPKYVHTAQLMKLDNGNKRKLSKRKDPELALDYYKEQGYCVAAVTEYILTLLNSNFEDWRLANPDAPASEFKFTTKKMGGSGALFDIEKLEDVSKNVISRMSATEARDLLTIWAEQYDPEFHALLVREPDYTSAILGIGRGGKKPRKDIAIWSGAKDYMSFFFDELFAPDYLYPDGAPTEDAAKILAGYAEIYDPDDDSAAWFDKIRSLASQLGYAADMRDYKANPDEYRGSVGDVSMVLRVAITGRQSSPDMYEVTRLLGRDRVLSRLKDAKDAALF